MPANKPQAPMTRQQLVPLQVGDAATDRALASVAEAVGRLDGSTRARTTMIASLVVGANVINHGLGRKPRLVLVSPTVANATFAYAMTSADDKRCTITVVGVAQPNAGIEVVA